MKCTGAKLFRHVPGAGAVALGLMVSSVLLRVAASTALARRPVFVPMQCLPQRASITAGTIFASSKLPLRLWFKTMYLVTQS